MSRHINLAEMFARHDASDGILKELFQFDIETQKELTRHLFALAAVKAPELCRIALDYGHLIQARRETDTPNTEMANDRS